MKLFINKQKVRRALFFPAIIAGASFLFIVGSTLEAKHDVFDNVFYADGVRYSATGWSTASETPPPMSTPQYVRDVRGSSFGQFDTGITETGFNQILMTAPQYARSIRDIPIDNTTYVTDSTGNYVTTESGARIVAGGGGISEETSLSKNLDLGKPLEEFLGKDLGGTLEGFLGKDLGGAVSKISGILGGNLGQLGGILKGELGGALKGILGKIGATIGAPVRYTPPGGGGLYVPVKDFVQIALQTDIRALNQRQVELLNKLVSKEYNLDATAYIAAKTTIRAVLTNVLNWVNTGDNGNPFYVINSIEYFNNVEHETIDKFLTEIRVLDVDPIIQRSIALGASPSFAQTIRPTVSAAQRNAFIQDFNNGGWDMWLQMLQSHNNPLGQYRLNANELERRTLEAELRKSQELAWGRGFKPAEVCITRDIDGNCTYAEIVTPGAFIESQMGEVFSSVIRQLEADDELNEVTSNLLSGMVAQILGGRKTGLRGFSPSAIISPASNAPAVNRTRSGLKGLVNTLLQNEFNYYVTKSSSLIRLNEAKESLNTLLTSATSTAENMEYATTTTQSMINPTLRALASDIIISTQLIDEIQKFAEEIERTNTAEGLSFIADKYIDISRNVHSGIDVERAQTEFETLDALTAEILQEVSARQEIIAQIEDS